MELKATLNDYTAPEFQALIDKIWAVDLPKLDHDRLINHFDRIVGHPRGADLLFYQEDTRGLIGSDAVIHHVRSWHKKQGKTAFKGDDISAPRPVERLSPVARSQADAQKISANLMASEQAVETAFVNFEQCIKYQHGQRNIQTTITTLETDIRALELAQHEALIAVSKFESWKMRVEFIKAAAQSNLTSARSEHEVWQSIAQQISATYDRYIAQLTTMTQRHRTLHDEAETLLIAAQEQLIRSRKLSGVGPTHTAHVVTGSLAHVDKLPAVLLPEGGSSALLASQHKDLQKSIRSVVGEFTWQNTSGEPTEGNDCAAVLQFEFSSRADTQVYGFSVPLAELVAIEGQDWQSLATNKAEVDVPFRMNTKVVPAKPGTMFKGLREVKILSQVYVTPLQGGHPSKVRVRAAHQGGHPDMFSFTADGAAAITVSWSGPVALEIDSSVGRTNRLGFVYSLPVPPLEPLIDKEDLHFDDYVVVFPEESGLDPLYVMFRDRREYPD